MSLSTDGLGVAGPVSTLRVVVGNEPRSYREALAAVLRLERPDVVVVSVDPDRVDSEVRKLEPGLVVASRQERNDGDHPLVWLALYPGGERVASVAVGGKPMLVRDIDLASVLCLVDWAQWLVTLGPSRRRVRSAQALPGLQPG